MDLINSKKSYFMLLSVFSIFALLMAVTSFNSKQADAADWGSCPERECILPGEIAYTQLGDILPILDLRRTVEGFIWHALFDNGCIFVWGKSCNTVLACGENILAQRRGLSAVCTIDPAECSQLNQVPDPSTVTYYQDMKKNTVAGNSVLGLANNFSDFITTEPVPVSLALYVNDAAARVPFVGTALAQGAPTYAGPFLDIILNIWKAARNAAYAILAIVMVFVGIMISTRKKINPQLAVSAQMALPKIVLAVILITFSYPIGATLASFGWGVGFSFHNFVMDINFAQGDAAAGFGVGNFTAAMFYLMVFRTNTGSLVVALASILGMVTLVFLLIAAVRVLIVYFKMLIDIIVSPVVFALGAIPGNESTTETWFRKMLAQAISIPAIWGVIGLTLQLSLGLLISIFDCTVQGLGYSLFVILAVPVMYIYGMFTALRMPGIVGNWINPQKKTR